MSLPIPAKEIAVGDYSPDYGTVKQVTGKSFDQIEITFVNGKVISPDADAEFMIDQGGRF